MYFEDLVGHDPTTYGLKDRRYCQLSYRSSKYIEFVSDQHLLTMLTNGFAIAGYVRFWCITPRPPFFTSARTTEVVINVPTHHGVQLSSKNLFRDIHNNCSRNNCLQGSMKSILTRKGNNTLFRDTYLSSSMKLSVITNDINVLQFVRHVNRYFGAAPWSLTRLDRFISAQSPDCSAA